MADVIVGGPERPPLSPAAVAERWGCSSTLIYDLLASGALRGFRLGKLWRIPAAAVEEYESGSPPPVDAPDADDSKPLSHDSNAATAARLGRLRS